MFSDGMKPEIGSAQVSHPIQRGRAASTSPVRSGSRGGGFSDLTLAALWGVGADFPDAFAMRCFQAERPSREVGHEPPDDGQNVPCQNNCSRPRRGGPLDVGSSGWGLEACMLRLRAATSAGAGQVNSDGRRNAPARFS